jgi:membrane protein required for colicin V production
MSLDLILVVVLCWGFYQGYSHGIIETVFTIFSYVFGALVAFKMTPWTTSTLCQVFKSDNPLMFLAGFLVMFVVVMMLIRLAGRGMEGAFDFAHMGMANKLFGGMLVGSFYVLLLSILVWFGNKASLIDDETKRTAKSYPVLEILPQKARVVAERVSPVVKDFWNSSVNMVDRLENYSEKNKNVEQRVYDLPTPKPTGNDVYAPYSTGEKKDN